MAPIPNSMEVLLAAWTSGEPARLSATGNALDVNIASGSAGGSSPPSGGGTGTKLVTTGGTAEALAATTACVRVHVQAKSGNTGSVWVGIGSAPEGDAIELVPLAGWTFETDDLANIFVNADTGNDGVDGVNYVYEAA